MQNGNIFRYSTTVTEYDIPHFDSEKIMQAAIESVGGEDEILRVLYVVEKVNKI